MPVEGLNNSLTPGEILHSIRQEDLFRFFSGGIEPGVLSSSPLRKDKNPSFIYGKVTESGRMQYRDFATGESGDIFAFIRSKYGVSFNDAINIILTNFEKFRTMPVSDGFVSSKKTKIQIKASVWNSFNVKYWYGYGIGKSTLIHYNVRPIKYYWVNGVRFRCEASYAYCFGGGHYKILNLDKEYKWISNTGSNIIQGYSQMNRNSDTLIITSGLKDVMVLYECGFNAVAPGSESSNISESTMQMFLNMFKRVIIYYDNDERGIQFSTALADKYNIPSIVNVKHKDPSDHSFYHGIPETKSMVMGLINDAYVGRKE